MNSLIAAMAFIISMLAAAVPAIIMAIFAGLGFFPRPAHEINTNRVLKMHSVRTFFVETSRLQEIITVIYT